MSEAQSCLAAAVAELERLRDGWKSRAERAEAEVARLKAALDAKPATYQEVDGILGGAGADLRALRDEYVDALALEGENGSMESGRRFIAARRALAAALAKQGEVGKCGA